MAAASADSKSDTSKCEIVEVFLQFQFTTGLATRTVKLTEPSGDITTLSGDAQILAYFPSATKENSLLILQRKKGSSVAVPEGSLEYQILCQLY